LLLSSYSSHRPYDNLNKEVTEYVTTFAKGIIPDVNMAELRGKVEYTVLLEL
jgi:hypothetical protein